MATNDQLLTLLSHHIGKGNGIGVKQLARQLGIQERQVRTLVSELRNEGRAICATPKYGYYIASTADELQQTDTFLYKRAIHSLTMLSRLRRIPLPDLLGQLHLPT